MVKCKNKSNETADTDTESPDSQQDIKKIVASLPTKKMIVNGKVMEIYQLPKGEEITPIGKLIASVNKGKVKAREADWKHLVQAGFRAEQATPMTFMYWLLDNLTDIHIRDYRIDALLTIIENIPAYLQEVEAPDDVQSRYKQDCKNLLHYFRQINYIIPYFDEAGHYWNEHRDDDQLDVETYLYFRFLDQLDDLKEYIAFSQAHYVAIRDKTHRFIPTIVAAQSEQYRDKLEVEDIISFCSSLYMAETTRQKFIAGWEKPLPRLTIDDIDWELRNRCFDFYIEQRIQDIRTNLRTDNRRLHGPSTQECYACLMESEQQAYNRLKGLEHFRGSAAYAREWKQGTPDNLAMTELFLQYLEEKRNSALIEKQQNNFTLNQMSASTTMSTTSNNHCDFQFVIREYPTDKEYRDTWLWQDQSKYISINWRDLQAMLDICPTEDYQKPRLWLREYLKNHPEVRINDWQEIFHEVRSLMLSYVEDFFRLNKEYRLFGHDYNWFADASLAEVEEWLHISCWEHAFHNYAVPSFEIPADAPASAAAASFSQSSNHISAGNDFLWPLYTAKATDADKRDFEQYLSLLCSKPTKSQTSDIKLYLRLKEEQHIIIRPSQQSEEYDLICSFGYQRAKKTYYNS